MSAHRVASTYNQAIFSRGAPVRLELSLIRFVLLLGLTCMMWGTAAASGAVSSDDEFLETLSAGETNLPVDRDRLALLFSNVALTLKAEKPQLRNMQELIRVPSALRENALQVMASRFDGYAAGVDRFAAHAVELKQEPRSILSMYHTLRDGQRTCWMLDLYTQLLGTWSGGGAELRAIMPSRAACGRFRTAAFIPRVERIVGDSLMDQVFQREEIRRLNEELADLQDLLDDLTRIDARE